MPDSKISDLTALAAASNDDLLPIVDDPSGSPVTKKITVAALHTIVNSVAAATALSVTAHASQSVDTASIMSSAGVNWLSVGSGGIVKIGAPNSYMAASSVLRIGTTASVAVAIGNNSASGSGTGAVVGLYSDDGAAMASGDRLGGFLFGGSSSAAAVRNTAAVFAYASGAWTDAASYPTDLVFETTASGATSRTERLRIDAAGDFTIAEGGDFILGTTTGSKIGTATTQKLGFWNATPIVRPTGWGAPTGTATRTTFATTTVTTELLAQRVKALIDDLTTMGLIGA